jgi:protein required for attachment to host cells
MARELLDYAMKIQKGGVMTKLSIEPIDLLHKLGDQYRHVEQEHQRQPPRSATRHRIAAELQSIQDHFERLLVEWVADDGLRTRWREFLYGREPAPDSPRLPPPPLFKGRTDAGATIDIRPVPDGYDVIVDGARLDHSSAPWHLDPDMRGPVQIGGHACEEIFDAPEPAVRELTEFLAGRAGPPWRWARELLEDGLIDAALALTPRGKRCLERARPVSEPAPRVRNHCVLVADAARARVWVLDADGGGNAPSIFELVEVAEITNPILRARDVEVVSDSGTGRRGGAKTPIHAPPDHRDHRRRDLERHFAAQVAEEAAAVWRRYPSCELIVAASPVMLGLLRPALARQIRVTDQVHVRELPRDLTKLTGPALHDLLAEDELLPPRGRRPPVLPTPGQPT